MWGRWTGWCHFMPTQQPCISAHHFFRCGGEMQRVRHIAAHPQCGGKVRCDAEVAAVSGHVVRMIHEEYVTAKFGGLREWCCGRGCQMPSFLQEAETLEFFSDMIWYEIYSHMWCMTALRFFGSLHARHVSFLGSDKTFCLWTEWSDYGPFWTQWEGLFPFCATSMSWELAK